MNVQTLWVPFSVLNAPNHNVHTRLVWILLSRHLALDEARLRKLSGFDPKTISQARSKLSREPLAACYTRPYRTCAEMPVPLLADTRLSARARLLYGQLQALPGYADHAGSFTYATLSHRIGSCDDALRHEATELTAAGWLTISQKNRSSPLQFTLQNPIGTQLQARISSIRRRVRGANPRGEALLREYLNALVAIDDYEDNAAPDFLLNPYTRELMELDRYYPTAAVAFELNGDQHYEHTDLATFEQTVKQVGRDAMKAFICKAQGIELVILLPEDLSLKALEQKLPRQLPRRSLEELEPLISALEGLASEHRARTADERERRAGRPA
ncbi:MAG TPA: hypothetical protein VNT01_11315 [Symbiobacteriaceae bacterium]|nr:hypothetical protein [Symbiobacteriaceae bacterium]